VDDRLRRRVLNETGFRELNERIERINERFADETGSGEFSIVCECSSTDCVERFPVAQAEYRRIRSVDEWFAVLPGHEDPAIERIVEENDEYFVIEKLEEEPAAIARATAPD
jgi:hypothetical protein